MGSAASSAKSQSEKQVHHNGVKHSNQSGYSSQKTPVQVEQRNQKLPAPLPPRTRKEDIFKEANYRHVDEYVRKMPARFNYGTFDDLVAYLTSPKEWDEIAKVRAIFRWVTSVDVFSLQFDRQPPKGSPMEYFLRIQNNKGNHAHLMAGMCHIAKITCIIINGMNKSAAFQIGKKLDMEGMRAQWNAVYVAGNWRFIDAFWACACVVGKKTGEWALVDVDTDEQDHEDAHEGTTHHRTNEFYFFPDPDQFIWTHLPDEAVWQLLKKPVSVDEFETHFYIRERFHFMGMTVVPRTKVTCIQETQNGEVELYFGLPSDRSANYRFKYILYKSRKDTSGSKIETFFDRFVLYEKRKDILRFALRFPISGNFKIDIYGLDVEDGDVFDLCCTYIINCPTAKRNCLPLPDCPPLGWGSVSDIEKQGLQPTTHKEAEIVSKDGIVQIRLSKDRLLAFYQLLKHSLLDEATLSKFSVAELKQDEAVVYLRLPQQGEYALKLFSQDLHTKGPAKNVLNYLISCNSISKDLQPFPNVPNGLVGRNPTTNKNYGVQAVSHPEAYLSAKNGRIIIEFRASMTVELNCEMHTINEKAAKEMNNVVKNRGQQWVFDLDMPVKGEYSFNVFVREKGQSDQLHSVHSYLINSDGRRGAGDDAGSEDNGTVETIIPTETFDTSEGEVTIPAPQTCEKLVAAIQRRNGYDLPDPSQITCFSDDDRNMVKVRLMSYAEYMINMYDFDKDKNRVRSIAKYQINKKRPGELYHNNISSIMADITPNRVQSSLRNGDTSSLRNGDTSSLRNGDTSSLRNGDTSKDELMRQARLNIQVALNFKDARHLEEAMKQFLSLGGDENDPLLKRAREQLEILRAKAELMEASQKRNLALLEKAISRAKSVNVNQELDVQIALAVKLRDHLATVERLRHAVLNMEAKTVAEIKSYSNPPDGVHQCMIATFLLLGHQLKEVKNWQKVQGLLGKTGKESVMRKISSFDAQAVPLKRALVAKTTIEPYSKAQIRDVSAGAATFYIWVVGMIKEVEAYGGTEQTDHLRLIK